MKREEALRYANEAGLTSMLETPRIPYPDWASRILRLVELVEQHKENHETIRQDTDHRLRDTLVEQELHPDEDNNGGVHT